MVSTTQPKNGSDPLSKKTDDKDAEKYLVWVSVGPWSRSLGGRPSAGPGAVKLATVRNFDTIDAAASWAHDLRDYEIYPVGQTPEGAELSSIQAMRQMTER